MPAKVPSPFAGSLSVVKAPSRIESDFTLTATVRNNSETRWGSGASNPVHAAYHWLDAEWNMVVFDGLRTSLPDDGLPPQTLTEIPLRVELPPKPGCYILQPTLVQEGVAWFESQSGFSAPTLAVEVIEASRDNLVEDLSRFSTPALASVAFGELWVIPSDSVIGASLLTHGSFEEKEVKTVRDFLTTEYGFTAKQFIDIGANIGTHLIYALRTGLFDYGVAFEADPTNYDLLVRNIRHNTLDERSRAFHIAITNRAGTITLEQAPDNLGDHRIRIDGPQLSYNYYNEDNRKTVCLASESLDNLDAEHQLTIDSNSLLWLDVQGHEGHVLEGARSLIERKRIKFLVTEFWPYGLQRSSGKHKIFDFLPRCSAIYDLHQPDWWKAAPIGYESVSAKYDDLLALGINHTDLLCVL